jgi:hypothetical protein
MNGNPANRPSCIVCGLEPKRHNGWFLVMDNCWLDRVRVFSWHPVLARDERMRAVCGTDHLKTLLTHWLNHANLQLVAAGVSPCAPTITSAQPRSDQPVYTMGKVVGELAVQRTALSREWTGSPEARECILDALIGGTESHARGRQNLLPDGWPGDTREYAFH